TALSDSPAVVALARKRKGRRIAPAAFCPFHQLAGEISRSQVVSIDTCQDDHHFRSGSISIGIRRDDGVSAALMPGDAMGNEARILAEATLGAKILIATSRYGVDVG